MSISHELSSDIATALFSAKERSPRELDELKDMVFKIHLALEELSEKGRQHRCSTQTASKSAEPRAWQGVN